ncbi:HDIG domain-containing protein [Desulfovibrio sp. OttesenSCG-928-A18]|nr:HDIG domain-containing protein [Desulfovibrio sp. OttesenSCG-928-A18]
MITREDALILLESFQPEAHMLRHALASEAVMRALARHFSEDGGLWAMAGLLHDVDYPLTMDNPDEHGVRAMEILKDKLPQEALDAIKAHNSECTGLEPRSRLDFALRAGESITGLVNAAVLMRPMGIEGMQVKSLKKKMKDKAFAAAVSRERIRECERAGLGLDDFLGLAISAMTPLYTETGGN